MVDDPTSPTVAATSSPVTITDPSVTLPSILVSAPGSVQEASVGAGVTVPLTVATSNLPGDIYYEVLNSSGTVETPYTAALPAGAAIMLPPPSRNRKLTSRSPCRSRSTTFRSEPTWNIQPIPLA